MITFWVVIDLAVLAASVLGLAWLEDEPETSPARPRLTGGHSRVNRETVARSGPGSNALDLLLAFSPAPVRLRQPRSALDDAPRAVWMQAARDVLAERDTVVMERVTETAGAE